MGHDEARGCAARALTRLLGHEPATGAIKALAGVANLETSYGQGWRGAGKGSFNMGAIQCGSAWTGKRFSYIDTHPNADGTSTPYRVDFRAYDSEEDGWLDLAKVVYVNRGRSKVLDAAERGDWFEVSAQLRRTGYYEGFGPTVEARIANHHRALARGIAAADGGRMPSIRVACEMPTLRRGDRGPKGGAVWLLQTELQIAADGAFGPLTESEVRGYQLEHLNLTPTGICDPEMWALLLDDDYMPGAA